MRLDFASLLFLFCFVFIICVDQALSCKAIIEILQNFPVDKVKLLGVSLNVPTTKLVLFQYNNPRNGAQEMLDIINYWLNNDSTKSWSKLANAVEVYHKPLAKKIRADKIKQKS